MFQKQGHCGVSRKSGFRPINDHSNCSYTKSFPKSHLFTQKSKMERRTCAHEEHGVYEILPLPQEIHVLGGGWVFVKKPGSDGAPICFKARYSQAEPRGSPFSNYCGPHARDCDPICAWIVVQPRGKLCPSSAGHL